jgi:hypothetical protein
MTDEIDQLLRSLHLKRIAAIIDDELAHAKTQQLSYDTLLARLLRAQYQHRQDTSLAWRIQQAQLPETWTLESFPFKRQPGVNPKQIRALAELEFVAKAENIVLIGPTGGEDRAGVRPGAQGHSEWVSRPLHPRAGSLRRDVCVAGRSLDPSAPQQLDPDPVLAHRRSSGT